MQKVLTIVGLLTVVVTPAFAQDFSASWGTGNLVPFAYPPTTADKQKMPSTEGYNAFAMVRDAKAKVSADSPALNGGGSDGYNWALEHNQ